VRVGVLFIGDLSRAAGTLLRVGGLTRHLKKFDCEAIYFSKFPPPGEFLGEVKYIKLPRHISGLPFDLMATYPKLKMFSKLFHIDELINKIQRNKIDLLHCHQHPSAFVGYAISDKINVPILFDVHGIIALQEKEAKSNIRKHILYSSRLKSEKKLFKNINFLNVRSGREKEWVSKYFCIPSDKIFISPDGVEIPHPSELISENIITTTRRKEGWEGKKVILFVGALKWISGIFDILRSYQLVKKKREDVILVLVGNNYALHEAKDYIQMEKLKDVFFKGYLPYSEVLRLQKAASILIIPETDSLYNQLEPPLKTLEAMAMKKPLVCTRLKCYEDLLDDQENAVLVDPGDPKSIAEGIEKILNNPDLERKISENAYLSIPPNRIWSNISKQIVQHYKTMLQSSPL
jgi:glycosyltransferase involved in cell wall biosynthesis